MAFITYILLTGVSYGFKDQCEPMTSMPLLIVP